LLARLFYSRHRGGSLNPTDQGDTTGAVTPDRHNTPRQDAGTAPPPP